MRNIEYELFSQQVRKLKDFCREANLTPRLECGSYPVTLTLTPDENYQMSLLDAPPGDEAGAYLTFMLHEGEVKESAHGGFTITDANWKKLSGLFAKISAYWTQYVYQRFAMSPDENGVLGEGVAALWRRAKAENDV